MQAKLVITASCSEAVATSMAEAAIESIIAESHQTSVKYLLEWVVIR